MEWETLQPKVTPLPQTEHLAIILNLLFGAEKLSISLETAIIIA
jgi:hypothetical protein